jgi:hypothetical protein
MVRAKCVETVKRFDMECTKDWLSCGRYYGIFGYYNVPRLSRVREGDRECVEGEGSSRAVTRLHTMIGLTGYRSRDLLRIRRALYRLTEKA